MLLCSVAFSVAGISEICYNEEKSEFYNYLRSLDAIKGSLGDNNNNTLILDKDSELASILYGRE